jgi:hypothetical protein
VFVVATFKELNNPRAQTANSVEGGPRADLIRFIGNLFDQEPTEKINLKQKTIMYKQVQRTISDMESDGVYFPIEIKEQLEKKREQLTCEYSGLKSLMSYLEEDDFYNGHS